MASGGYAVRRPGTRGVRRGPELADGSQRALFAFAILTLFLAATYSGVAMLARVTPALFPGRSLRNVGAISLLENVVPIPEASATGSFTDRITILVLGIDKRSNREFEEDGAYLTDVVMVVSIDPITKKSTVLSFPRDMWIEIHAKDGASYPDRINVSYESGVLAGKSRGAGIEQVKRDMQKNFGIEIDHSVLIDFKGVEGLVDALGGITVDVPEELAVYDWVYSDDDRNVQWLSFPVGLNDMNGYQAVAFGRNRDGDSDLYRIKRQQLVMQAAVAKSFTGGIIGLEAFELWDAYSDLARTDIARTEMPGLADLARRTNGSTVFYSLGDPVDGVPTMIPFTTDGGAAVLRWNPENVQYWLARAFPVTRHADAVVELQNAYPDRAQGDSRTAALGRFLKYSRGLVTVYYGDNSSAQPRTVVILRRAEQRKAAEDIAEWLGLGTGGVSFQPADEGDTFSPDITVIVGADFVIPQTG